MRKANNWAAYNNMSMTKPMGPQDVWNQVNRFWASVDDEKEFAAALALAWLFGLRCSELITYSFSKKIKELGPKFETIEFTKPGPTVENIYAQELPNGDEILYGVIHRLRKGKYNLPRLLAKFRNEQFMETATEQQIDSANKKINEIISLKLSPLEGKKTPILFYYKDKTNEDFNFVMLLKDYIYSYLPEKYNLDINNNPLDEMKWKKLQLIPHNRNWLQNKMAKHFPDESLSWHCLRKARVTYLSSRYGFSINDLLEFIQWQSPLMPSRYIAHGEWSILSRVRQQMDDSGKDEILDTLPIEDVETYEEDKVVGENNDN